MFERMFMLRSKPMCSVKTKKLRSSENFFSSLMKTDTNITFEVKKQLMDWVTMVTSCQGDICDMLYVRCHMTCFVQGSDSTVWKGKSKHKVIEQDKKIYFLINCIPPPVFCGPHKINVLLLQFICRFSFFLINFDCKNGCS